MIRLTDHQIEASIELVENYIKADNAATGSKLDSNANVTSKNIATLEAELVKGYKIQVNRALIKNKIEQLFNKELAENYIADLESHLIYTHDETSLAPYCVSISMYPFLTDGIKNIGGEGDAPKHLTSFCGNFINLVFAVSAQFAGAVATVEYLMYFDYFARKDYGDDYLEDHYNEVMQQMQGVVYAINQPAMARNYQSCFWNISTFDKPFFDGMFGTFVFPDLTAPNWDTLNALQKEFHRWFRGERKKQLLTFPVVTHAAIANENKDDWSDNDSADFIAEEMSKGGEFFIYTSQTADSLASCCRMKNEVSDNTFSYSLGAGGVSTGSKNVITINMNRLVQEGHDLEDVIKRVQKYQYAFHVHFKDWQQQKMLPVYDAGFISLDKQYLTLGINGMLESAEYLGYNISDNKHYKKYLSHVLSTFKKLNVMAKKEFGVMYNTEITPSENLGVKNAKWDKADGLAVSRDCYNSYMYRVEDNINLFDKMNLHGGDIVKNLDGGSALHFNNDKRMSKEQYRSVLSCLVKTGCNYFCENVPKTCCNECGNIEADNLPSCPKCGSSNIDYATRVIGYLKRVKSFSGERQTEESKRNYEVR